MNLDPKKPVRIGTRGSRLALVQAGIVAGALRAAHPGVQFEVVTITTKGDANRTAPVAAIGVGVFVKELEAALEDGRIDLAVHSAKDLPSTLPGGSVIAAVLAREDPRDVLVSRHAGGLSGLPRGARVATGSARRRALLLAGRPDLKMEPIRGNVGTRLSKLRDAANGFDAIVLAAAGLARLGRLDEVSEFLDPAIFVPAVGQGALAVEARAGDGAAIALAAAVEHRPDRLAVEAERAFLDAVGGGCSAPVTAHAVIEDNRLTLNAFAAEADGSNPVYHGESGHAGDAVKIGRRAAKALLAAGGARALAHAPAAPAVSSSASPGQDDD